MKLAISNIAWNAELEPRVLALLSRLNCDASVPPVEGIEVAPTKYWPDWNGATFRAARECSDRLLEAGFKVPSFQSIVFGRPELGLFETPALFIKHMEKVALLAEAFGAGRLVYGAPKSRLKGGRTWAQAVDACVPTLRTIGEICTDHNTVFVIEPNPTDYGCDFVTNAAEGCALISSVDHPGVRLHLDCAGMYLAGDAVGEAIGMGIGWLAHAHLSEPGLGDFSAPVAPQPQMLSALRRNGYEGWVAIEMRQSEDAINAIELAVAYVRQRCWEA